MLNVHKLRMKHSTFRPKMLDFNQYMADVRILWSVLKGEGSTNHALAQNRNIDMFDLAQVGVLLIFQVLPSAQGTFGLHHGLDFSDPC